MADDGPRTSRVTQLGVALRLLRPRQSAQITIVHKRATRDAAPGPPPNDVACAQRADVAAD